MIDAPSPNSAQADPRSTLRKDWIVVGVLSVLILVAAGGVLWWDSVMFPAGAGGHSHGEASASVGEPGNPSLPSRTIEVAMVEHGGAMGFEPSVLEVAKGAQIRFVIANKGLLDHEFVLATLADNLEHLEAMKKFPDMVHKDPNAITLVPDAHGEILWHFTSAGTFDFSCLIPGHREAGMHGSIVVK